MTSPGVTVAAQDVHEDRFSRFRLTLVGQNKIRATRVLVVGAGALGNEILKNLALLGFEQIVVVNSTGSKNPTSRATILYRASDIGEYKAHVAARSTEAILPGAVVRPLVANIMYDCGLGLFRWADLILAGLDNREARLGSTAQHGRWGGRGLMAPLKESTAWCGRFFRAHRHATSARSEKPTGSCWSSACPASAAA